VIHGKQEYSKSTTIVCVGNGSATSSSFPSAFIEELYVYMIDREKKD
jgi:hypothetical protein